MKNASETNAQPPQDPMTESPPSTNPRQGKETVKDSGSKREQSQKQAILHAYIRDHSKQKKRPVSLPQGQHAQTRQFYKKKSVTHSHILEINPTGVHEVPVKPPATVPWISQPKENNTQTVTTTPGDDNTIQPLPLPGKEQPQTTTARRSPPPRPPHPAPLPSAPAPRRTRSPCRPPAG